MLVIRRTVWAQTVSAGVDRVIGHVYLPKGGKLKSVSGEIHAVGPESQSTSKFNAYGVSGQMVEIVDPETAINVASSWDDIVVKASDPVLVASTNGFDFDWITDDTTPEIEPGQMDIDALLGMTQDQKEFMAPRLEWVSWAKNRQGGFAAGTPDTYQPADYKTFSSKRNLTAESPSVAMIGFSSPNLDEVQSSNIQSPSSAGEWYMLQNMDSTLQKMAEMQAGLTVAGAESPYVEATTLIQDMVAPQLFDESTTLYAGVTWDVLCMATWLIELPGRDLPRTLDGR